MRITQWGEYGVHFSTHIAQREREGTAIVGAAEIAHDQGVDIQYAQQILQRLRRGGIIDSVRGPQGGYKLTRPASEITLLDILVAAEGDTFELICEAKPLGQTRCSAEAFCGLRPIWYDLKDHVNEFLRRYTLEALAAQGASEAPIQLGGTAHSSNTAS